MVIVDATFKFVYMNVASQGRLSDGGLFAQIDLRKAIDKGLLNVPKPEPMPNTIMPYMLISDDAFPL